MDEKFPNLTWHKYTGSIINPFHWRLWGYTKVTSKTGSTWLFKAVSCYCPANPELEERSPILIPGFGHAIASTCYRFIGVYKVKVFTEASACKVCAISQNKDLTKGKSASIGNWRASLDTSFLLCVSHFCDSPHISVWGLDWKNREGKEHQPLQVFMASWFVGGKKKCFAHVSQDQS